MKSSRSVRSCLLTIFLTIAFSGSSRADATLADAAESQDWKLVERLLREGKSPRENLQADAMTALHWAVYHDERTAVRTLIRAGADVNAVNRYQVTPLSLACLNGNAAIARELLDAGADPNRALTGGETPLMTASRTGKLDLVDLLLQRGAKVDAIERQGQTALMWAAAEGHAPVVQRLIDAGADAGSSLASGFTPLMFAAREGRLEAVEVLLKAGAPVGDTIRQKRSGPRTPQPGTTALMLAIENAHFQLAAKLLEAGADPNDQRTGYAALHMMTWVRKPNRGDGEDGDPAPTGSGNLTSLEFVRKLVEHKADVNLRIERGSGGRGVLNRRGATPFLLAAMTADVPLMKLLKELGADPSIPNSEGCTALMAAAGIGTLAPGEVAGKEDECLAAVAFAIELGGDVNAVDHNGETAMHGAAYKSLPKMVRFLVEQGARRDVWNTKNKHGWTPLDIARGYRPGNFKPSAETIAAIEQAQRE